MSSQRSRLKQLSAPSDKELRWDFFPMFEKLMKKGLETEAYLFMMSTWNFARFRYAIRGFNLTSFQEKIKSLSALFSRFNNTDISKIKLDNYKSEITKIFSVLSSIKGIEKTGATKIMHLRKPKIFVMWDNYIRELYGFKKGDAGDYFNFLKLMQAKFGHMKDGSGRTLAKRIDEHNYQTITEPILRKNKRQRNVAR